MTKNILLSITGLQDFGNEDDSVELVTTGEYFYKNSKHYILYDEVMEDTELVVNNMIKISDNEVMINKKGMTSAQLHFSQGERNVTNYVMDFGEMMLGISTKELQIKDTDDNIDVNIKYSLEINSEHVSDCNIKINVKSMEV